jgi:hypothetical protein
MGFGGVQGMITSLKNNSNLIGRKGRTKYLKKQVQSLSTKYLKNQQKKNVKHLFFKLYFL